MYYTTCFAVITLFTVVALGCSAAKKSVFPWASDKADTNNFERELSVARLSERHGDLSNALQVYRGILDKSPNNVSAHHRLGVIAARERQFDEAMQHFKVAETSAPNNAELLNDIGYALYLQNELPAAESKIKAALTIDPQNQAAHNNLGLVLGEQGRLDECLTEFRRAVGEAEAHTNLAYVQAQNGDLEGAKANYHRALDMDSKIRPAAEALVQLESTKQQRQQRNRSVPERPQQRPQMVASANREPTERQSTSRRAQYYEPLDSQFQQNREVVPVSYDQPDQEHMERNDGTPQRLDVAARGLRPLRPTNGSPVDELIAEQRIGAPSSGARSEKPNGAVGESTPWPNPVSQ